MKLQEGQVWKKGDAYLRIVHWERLSIVYKAMPDLRGKQGTEHQVTKKEFCRLIQGAVLLSPEEVRAARDHAPTPASPQPILTSPTSSSAPRQASAE